MTKNWSEFFRAHLDGVRNCLLLKRGIVVATTLLRLSGGGLNKAPRLQSNRCLLRPSSAYASKLATLP